MRKLLTFLGLLLLSLSAFAADSFIIKDIRVEGLQRISPGTVFNYLPVKVGDEMSAKQAKGIIRALYKSKYFNDVQVEEIDGILVIKVTERPAISSIELVGNKDIDGDELLKSLSQIGFAEGQVYEKAMLERVELELERQYFSRGKYGVTIESTVTPLSRNRVSIRITMAEGVVATIGGVNIVGNNAFDEDTLLDEFTSTTGSILSRFTNDNQYSRQKLSADLETLRSYYLDRGYVDFAVESTQVSITPDKKQMFITVNITEGDLYHIQEVRLAGNLTLPEEALFGLITIPRNSIFSRKDITSSTRNITDRLGDEGYAFANVNAVPDIDRENNLVKLTFFVDPGRRAYVRRITMTGNTSTRDEVLRREMRQMESAWISTKKVNQSRARIARLGYFQDVNVETLPVPGTADQVDLAFNVIEQQSGSISAGLGYSDSEGVILNANVTQKNFLGSGKHIRFGFNTSKVNTLYSFGYTNPFVTVDGISRGFNVFYRTTDAAEANVASFNTDVWGGDVQFGIPISEENRIFLGLGYENTNLKLGDDSPQSYKDWIANNPETCGEQEDPHKCKFDNGVVTLAWTGDTRDNAVLPTSGMHQVVSAEVASPLGTSLQYYKARYKNNWYYPLTRNLTFATRANLGYGDAYGTTNDYPFFKNYYAGGIRSVRGYLANTLGPKEDGRALGGNLLVTGGLDLIFPIPFVKKQLKSFRLSAFADVGNVYGINEDFEADLLRYSVGLGAIWLSPFGAMTFSFAAPYNEQPDDTTESFQFSLGTTF